MTNSYLTPDDVEFWFTQQEIPPRPRRMAKGLYGNGRLASLADLRDLLGPGDADGHALRLRGVTVLVEATPDGSELRPLLQRQLVIPTWLRERHLLLSGATGVGKTQKWILPQLAADIAEPGRTVIALDAKGGVLHDYMVRLAGRYRPGQAVHQINMKRPGRSTISWNPVSHVRTRSEALEVAHAVCTNVDMGIPPKDPFWVNSSIALLKDIVHALAHNEQEEKSLIRARELIDGFPLELAKFADANPKGYPAIYRVLESPTQNPSASIIADLAQRLMLFDDEGVVECMRKPNELRLEEVVQAGGLLVVEVFESDAAEMLPLTNLFITQLFRCLINVATTRPDGRLPCPTSLILDELGSACGVIPSFDKRLSTLRSRGVCITGAVQTLSQLENLYGKAAGPILDGFNTKVFFGGGLSLPDSQYASSLSGMMTCESVSVSEEREDYAGAEGRVSRTRTPVGRHVLLPDEIARPPVNRLLGPPVTVFTPDLPPFLAYLTPAFKLPETEWALTPLSRDAQESQPPVPGAPRAGKRRALERACREALGWKQMQGATRRWWCELGKTHRRNPGRMLRLLRRLERLLPLYRQLTQRSPEGLLGELAQAYRSNGLGDVETSLVYLRYSLLRRVQDQKNKLEPR